MFKPPRQLESEAFRGAVLRGEHKRIIGIISLLCAMLGVVATRTFLTGAGLIENWSLRMVVSYTSLSLLLIAGILVFEWAMLVRVRRAIRDKRDVSDKVWFFSIVFETMMPTLAIWLLSHMQWVGGYKALVAPSVFLYFLFIILSPLRLRPSLCLFTGFLSAANYAVVIGYIHYRFPDPDHTLRIFSPSIHVTGVITMAFAGMVAWFVTREVRTHVTSALREAEARNRAARMEHDLDIARSIQQGLLPGEAPDVPGYDIAGWNRPADQTGGDYYDWQALPDGRLAVSLADVTGHGIGPAMVASACRAYARGSTQIDTDLESVMSRINDRLYEDLPADRFITLVAAVLDTDSSTVQLLSAGHAPLYFYEAANDHMHTFGAHGIPLGIVPGIQYGPVQTLDMKPGDTLVLITDGFFEWANPDGQMFGIERLGQAIRSAKDLPAAEQIQQLQAAVESFANGTPQNDDLTAVIIKRHKV